VDAAEAEKARLEAERQAQQRAIESRPGAKAVGKPIPPAGPAKTFSDQLKGVKSERDPLLERITKNGDKGTSRTP
jgi:hypothetical protein